jgi:hypothetical protein
MGQQAEFDENMQMDGQWMNGGDGNISCKSES